MNTGAEALRVVQTAYAAFGRGDLPAIPELVSEDVDCNRVVQAYPVPPCAGNTPNAPIALDTADGLAARTPPLLQHRLGYAYFFYIARIPAGARHRGRKCARVPHHLRHTIWTIFQPACNQLRGIRD